MPKLCGLDDPGRLVTRLQRRWRGGWNILLESKGQPRRGAGTRMLGQALL
jgi:hypothetical protein